MQNHIWWEGLNKTWQNIFKKATKSEPSYPDFFEKITNLPALDCSGYGIDYLEPLRGLNKIKKLKCKNNPIKDFSPLSGMKNLEILHLDNTGITDLTPIKCLFNLRELYCSDNAIEDLSPLKSLFVKLEVLDCSINPIEDIRVSALLTNLRILKYTYSKETHRQLKLLLPEKDTMVYC